MAFQKKPRSPISISIITLSINLLLGGCSTFGTHVEQLPDDGPTTKAVYEGHLGLDAAARPAGTTAATDARVGQGDPTAWTRRLDNEFSLRFPRIPNHELHGFVFPHLTPKGRPVPGYSTSFPLYETIHYALPGEVAPAPRLDAEAQQ